MVDIKTCTNQIFQSLLLQYYLVFPIVFVSFRRLKSAFYITLLREIFLSLSQLCSCPPITTPNTIYFVEQDLELSYNYSLISFCFFLPGLLYR